MGTCAYGGWRGEDLALTGLQRGDPQARTQSGSA